MGQTAYYKAYIFTMSNIWSPAVGNNCVYLTNIIHGRNTTSTSATQYNSLKQQHIIDEILYRGSIIISPQEHMI